MTLTTRRRRSGVSYERLADAADTIARRTAGMEGGSLRVQWDRLDADEQAEVVRLTERLGEHDKQETRRWQQLVEKAAAQPGLFARLVEAAEVRRDIAALARQVVRRPFTRREESGIFHAIAEQVDSGCLLAEHVALLALIFTAFETGGLPPRSRGRIERDGEVPVLVVEPAFGPWGGDFDPEGDVTARWRQNLEHLEANAWVTVERHGGPWRVKPGVRALNALGAPVT